MRVLFFIHTYYPNKDGIAIHCYNLVNALKNKNIDVILAYPKSPIHLPGFSSIVLPDLTSIRKLLFEDYDIIHVHGYGNIHSIIGTLIGLIRGKKVVWTIHGIPDKHRLFKIYNFVAIHLLKKVKVISVSRAIESIHKKYYLIPNGIDLNKFKCNNSYKDQKYVTYIGRIDRDKNIERILKEYNGDIMIVGKDEDGYKNFLKSIANKNTIFTEIEYDKIVEAYCNSRYIVLPSKYEGFPMIMLESLACKRPFIATPVGEIPEFLKSIFGEGYVKYIIDTNISEVLSRLDKFDLNHELTIAREKLKDYSWDSIADKTIQVYLDALGRQRD